MYGPAARCKRFSSSCRFAVLHQCIRPLIGAFAPGHHGYQRACVLISGQASTGPLGSPVFACAGKTDPPSLLIPLADLGWKLLIDSSLRDVKQDDSNNEVAPSRGGEQIDDILDGLVGAVVGGFKSAVWAILRVRTAVEAAVGKWSAQPFVEEQK